MQGILDKAKFRLIDIKDINLSDNGFDCWRLPSAPTRKYKPNNPVWLLSGGGGYLVVAERENVSAAEEEGIKTVPAFCFDNNIEQKSLWLAKLSSLNGKVSPIEAQRLLSHFRDNEIFSEAELLDKVVPLLGLGKGEKVYNDIAGLSALEESAARYCAEKGIGLSECVIWATMPREAQCAVLVFASGIGLQGNLLRSSLNLLDEISVRQSLPVQEILQDKALRDILLDPDTARSAGREIFHRRLREIRYPAVSRLKEDLSNLAAESGFGGDIQLRLPENLEGDTLEISCRFSSPGQLSKLVGKLKKASKEPALEKIFNVLGKPAD